MKLSDLPIQKVSAGYKEITRVDAVFLEYIYCGQKWESEKLMLILQLWDKTTADMLKIDGQHRANLYMKDVEAQLAQL